MNAQDLEQPLALAKGIIRDANKHRMSRARYRPDRPVHPSIHAPEVTQLIRTHELILTNAVAVEALRRPSHPKGRNHVMALKYARLSIQWYTNSEAVLRPIEDGPRQQGS